MQFVSDTLRSDQRGVIDGWCQISWQTKHATERCVGSADSDGDVDQEVAVLYTGELTNCLWAEKAEHWEMWRGKKRSKEDDVIL